MRKRAVMTAVAFFLSASFIWKFADADDTNKVSANSYNKSLSEQEITLAKAKAKSFYEKEVSLPIEEPTVTADTYEGYAAYAEYGPGNIVILETKVPFEEKYVNRYIVYVKDKNTKNWTQMQEGSTIQLPTTF